MVPAKSLASHTYEHKEREDREGNHLLNHLELPQRKGASEGGRTESVGRYHEAILGQGYTPRDQHDGYQAQLLELGFEGDLTIPGQRHEGIRYDQKADC